MADQPRDNQLVYEIRLLLLLEPTIDELARLVFGKRGPLPQRERRSPIHFGLSLGLPHNHEFSMVRPRCAGAVFDLA